jgi:hypothetical protein
VLVARLTGSVHGQQAGSFQGEHRIPGMFGIARRGISTGKVPAGDGGGEHRGGNRPAAQQRGQRQEPLGGRAG